ncbi:tetratricopeptide repeat protein [Polynucleobacter sp. MWH-Svant-W18]|uniref:O-linked N-acetylglucosamine transferase, SPINDLY family protein n=1 Tax=Polynucleobacter sp. MWH-Svant-W18 TaxID=1855909 RepID=UPI001BFCE0F0|nr:tetratricopeptide repeat protein [Polynucleobacter sp. MWH-Svant-W18]QWD77732.1 tetratricopeptide repeat protein [Polynucleobacter sp. MWH-Svant-W18]
MNPQIAFLLTKSLESLRNSNLESAELYLKQALRFQSNNADVLRLLGVISAQRGEYSKALKHLGNSLKAFPKNALALSNIGNVYLELKEYVNALEAYDKSIKIDSKYAEAWSNKGNALSELKRNDEALAHYDKALSLNPNYAEAWSNKGNVLNELKRYDEALAHYDQALSLKPDYAEAWSNKAIVLNALKLYEQAIFHYEQALSFASSLDWVEGGLLHTKMKICHWNGLDQSIKKLRIGISTGDRVAPPFTMLALNDDLEMHRQCAQIYTQSKYQSNNALGPIPKYARNEKIRIGYFSGDFRNHAVSILTAELFELHDKDRFEIIAFSFGADDQSPIRLRLNQAFSQFIDVSAMSDVDVAKLARDLRIDIAIDLGGHTADSRTGIFSYRIAPIQLSYIGYLGTMGAKYYDYLLADRTIILEDLQKFYLEKIVYLPSYQANDRKRIISDRKFTRAELGIPETAFVFCCFNNNYKILPATFDCWMQILNSVECSVLFLYADNEQAKTNLINEAKKRGVDGARLVFGYFIAPEENLARYRVCDLFLDTFPYNAGTTASDALWAGLPVLTMMGESFASRVAASLLNAIDLPELITNTQEEYEALAIELARNPQKLTDIKLKLSNNRLITPLFDTPLFTKNLEAAYIKMYERYQADLQPEHLSIG